VSILAVERAAGDVATGEGSEPEEPVSDLLDAMARGGPHVAFIEVGGLVESVHRLLPPLDARQTGQPSLSAAPLDER